MEMSQDTFNNIAEHLMYPKAILLICIALLVLVWAIFFCATLVQKKGISSVKQYAYYVSYTAGLFVWILSNAYFHTGWLLEFGPKFAESVAILANLSTILAFGSAYYFSVKLRSHSTTFAVSPWQLIFAASVMSFCAAINFIPGIMLKSVSVVGPSNFILDFGPGTGLFFVALTLIFGLTFLNLWSIKRSGNRLSRTRVNYMILGMAIFMVSTAMIQMWFTFFFKNFSLTWLPPALSISEMLFMGYAILASRFYSFKYLCFVFLTVLITASGYATIAFISKPMDYLSMTVVMASIITVGLSWPHASKIVKTCLSYLLYGSANSPTEKIAKLEEEFQKSPSRAIESLASYLGVPSNSLKLLDDCQGASIYRSYFTNHSAPLVIDELEDGLQNTDDTELLTLRSSMNEMNSALVLPIYESNNKLTHVLVSSRKQGGLNFSFEELKALERVLQKVQVHINYERKVRQSQALANSIAHEMRNPFAQIQLEFESLNQKLDFPIEKIDLQKHVDKGKRSIKSGQQLIDIILREFNDSSLEHEPVEATSVTVALNGAINQYGFDNEQDIRRIKLKLDHDFVVKINETLFNFVIFNLLRNAIYYFDAYPSSTIEIRTQEGKYENHIIFKDTGPGIPKNLIDRIFDDFFSHKKSGGSGLGLGYCQRVMRSFGGSVSCHSVLHEHTTFTLSFPAKNIDVGTIFKQESGNVSYHPFPHHDNGKAEDPRLKSKSLTSHSILVVDDKEVQRTLVNLYLKQLGYSVILANNGKVAIEIIQSNPIDLVFMDIQMPIMDGFKAAKIIRETFPGIPIIALSGESGAEDLLKMEELMDGRLTKPTTKDSLDAALKSVLNKSKTT